jgi:hypothetical protein
MGKEALLAELDEAALTMIQGSLSEVTRVGADLKLTQPTDLSLTRGWVPAL